MTSTYDPEYVVPEAVSDLVEQLALRPDARLAKPVEEQSIDDIMAIYGARRRAIETARVLKTVVGENQAPECDLIRKLAALQLTEDGKPKLSGEAVDHIEEQLGDDALLNACADFREMEGEAYAIHRSRALSNIHASPCRKLNRGIEDLSGDDLFSIYFELKEVVEIAREIKAAGEENDSPEGDLITFMAEQWIAADATAEELEDYAGDVEEFESDLDEDRLFDAHGAIEAVEARLREHFTPTAAPGI